MKKNTANISSKHWTKKPLKIWSAASSSGEEAFSIAVQLLANSFSFTIFASDVSDSMLNMGRRAVYSNNRISNVPLSLLRSYFQKGSVKKSGKYKNLPFIMATAQADKGQQIAIMEAGGNGHVPKPFDAEQISEALNLFRLQGGKIIPAILLPCR